MSDNLGLNQTRVLDPTGRSFEGVVYQKRKPPLSCEANLDWMLASDQARSVATSTAPSGWEVVGTVSDDADESFSKAGDAVCSASYGANTFKLMASDLGIVSGRLAARVAGYRVVVQGTNSSLDENNVITLPVPPTIANRVDFVFLEVWRQLLSPTDVVYENGNILYGGLNPTNDLIDPAAGIETTRRVQIRYRIRVSSSDITTYPDGFDPNRVFAQANLQDPLSCSLAVFVPVPGDPGLWRAGNGDSASQTTLGTVDGYSYAIPMFAVTRRNTGAYDPDTRSNGSAKSTADFLAWKSSDRPDDLYNDLVVSRDILDMRHLTVSSIDLVAAAGDAFARVIRGNGAGKMTPVTFGEDHVGTTLTQVDSVAPADLAGSVKIASGSAGQANVSPCRVFSNASAVQKQTIYGPFLSADQTVSVSYGSTFPSNTVISSVEGAWNASGQLTLGVDYTLFGVGSADVGVHFNAATPAFLEYTVTFPSSAQHGLSKLPTAFLESRRTDSTSNYAMTFDGVRARAAEPVSTSDGTKVDMVQNRGAVSTAAWDFGHQMIHHEAGLGTSFIYFPRYLNGYQILGVAKAMVSGVERTYSVTRTSTQYAVQLAAPVVPVGADVEFILYTAGKAFVGNRQGRGIVDCFEMKELSPNAIVDGIKTSYVVDATNQVILAIAGSSQFGGNQFAYVNGAMVQLASENGSLPTDATKARATVDFFPSSKPTVGQTVEIPVLVRSAIGNTEGYNFFYETMPYQGLLDSTAIGTVVATGPAMVTTAGSGAVNDFTYTDGVASFTADSTDIQGMLGVTKWLQVARPGSLISADIYDATKYVVAEVVNDMTLKVTGKVAFTASTTAYTIINQDMPMKAPANVVDRLPTVDKTKDALNLGGDISTVTTDPYPVLDTRVVSPVQDVVGAGNVILGTTYVSPTTGRGQQTVYIPGSEYGVHAVGLKFEKLASDGTMAKTYQSYVFDKNYSGELYLMVVSSESDEDGASRFFDQNKGLDTVDIFELPGRPLRRPS